MPACIFFWLAGGAGLDCQSFRVIHHSKLTACWVDMHTAIAQRRQSSVGILSHVASSSVLKHWHPGSSVRIRSAQFAVNTLSFRSKAGKLGKLRIRDRWAMPILFSPEQVWEHHREDLLLYINIYFYLMGWTTSGQGKGVRETKNKTASPEHLLYL